MNLNSCFTINFQNKSVCIYVHDDDDDDDDDDESGVIGLVSTYSNLHV